MTNKKNQNDDLEIIVDIPSDEEIFANIFSFNKIKIKKSIKMTVREYKDYKLFIELCLTGTIILGSIGIYNQVSEFNEGIKNILNLK